MRPQVAFDPQPERHGAAGAADTRAVQFNAHDAGVGEIEELDIAPVGLDGGADFLDDRSDPVEGFGAMWGVVNHLT